MGWLMTPPALGEPHICIFSCTHTDCAATRALVATACVLCGERIGLAAKWYTTDAGPAHAICVWRDGGEA